MLIWFKASFQYSNFKRFSLKLLIPTGQDNAAVKKKAEALKRKPGAISTQKLNEMSNATQGLVDGWIRGQMGLDKDDKDDKVGKDGADGKEGAAEAGSRGASPRSGKKSKDGSARGSPADAKKDAEGKAVKGIVVRMTEAEERAAGVGIM
jgi:hypothetical protein